MYTSANAPVYQAGEAVKLLDEEATKDAFDLQASYAYYKHGPLKQVKLADGLQTTDYYYTVQGWLKAINNPNDTDNSDQDVFSMQLDYFAGDYEKANSGIIANALPEESDYSGNIQQQQWRTLTPAIANLPGNQVASAYRYQYDARYQLQSAIFGSMSNGSFTAATKQSYSTTGLDYDQNGNILGLQRRDQSGNLLHDFASAYQYTEGTNQLSSVTGYKSYTYNAIGQMTEEIGVDGSQKLSYDVSGKVREVRDENDALIAQYQYDDRGFRMSKQSYQNGLLNKTTYYVRDASGSLLSTYEEEAGSTLAQTEVPVYGNSRLGLYQPADGTLDFELKDHLGSVRAIIGSQTDGMNVKYYADYYSYGLLARSAGTPNRFGYQGSFAEDESELRGTVAFELRDWDPVIGRWLSPDPMGQYASPYLGMGNSPINRTDPDGGFDDTFYNSDGSVRATVERSWLFELLHGGDRNFIYGQSDDLFRLTDQGTALIQSGSFEGFWSDWQTSSDDLGFEGRVMASLEGYEWGQKIPLSYIIRESGYGGYMDQKLRLNSNMLYGFDGYANNVNEAGNIVWGATLRGFGYYNASTFLFAHGGTLKIAGRFDEADEVRAAMRGSSHMSTLGGLQRKFDIRIGRPVPAQ